VVTDDVAQVQEGRRMFVAERRNDSPASIDSPDLYTATWRPIRTVRHHPETDSENLLCSYTGETADSTSRTGEKSLPMAEDSLQCLLVARCNFSTNY